MAWTKSWFLVLAVCWMGVALPRVRGFDTDTCLSFNLTTLEDVAVVRVTNFLNLSIADLSLTIHDILNASYENLGEEALAAQLNISTECLKLLHFTPTEVSVILAKDPGKFRSVMTFKQAFRAIFTNTNQAITKYFESNANRSSAENVSWSKSINEMVTENKQDLQNVTLLSILLESHNKSSAEGLKDALSVTNPGVELHLLRFTAAELANTLAVGLEEVKNVSFSRLLRLTFIVDHMVYELRPSVQVNFTSLSHNREIANITVLQILQLKVSNSSSILALVLGLQPDKVAMLDITLEDIAPKTARNFSELRDMHVYPDLVTLITSSPDEFLELQAQQAVREAFYTITASYNVTVSEISVYFNLTLANVKLLGLFDLETLCARYTLYRYSVNLNIDLSQVAVKVGKTEAELTNITVQEFQVVIRRLMVVICFERMSVMMGVSQEYLTNILNVKGQLLHLLKFSDLDSLFNITRRTILDLRTVLKIRKLSFVTAVYRFSISRVYNFSLDVFVTKILKMNKRTFFGFLSIEFKESRWQILSRHTLKEIELFFRWNHHFPKRRYYIFRRSLRWIMKNIIYLVEHGKKPVVLWR